MNGHEFEQTPGDGGQQGRRVGSQRAGHNLVTKQQQRPIWEKILKKSGCMCMYNRLTLLCP